MPVRPDGKFDDPDLTPGDYTLRVFRGQGRVRAFDLTVNGSDINDVADCGGQTVHAPRPHRVHPQRAPGDAPKSTASSSARCANGLAQPVRSPAKDETTGRSRFRLPAGHVLLRAAPRGTRAAGGLPVAAESCDDDCSTSATPASTSRRTGDRQRHRRGDEPHAARCRGRDRRGWQHRARLFRDRLRAGSRALDRAGRYLSIARPACRRSLQYPDAARRLLRGRDERRRTERVDGPGIPSLARDRATRLRSATARQRRSTCGFLHAGGQRNEQLALQSLLMWPAPSPDRAMTSLSGVAGPRGIPQARAAAITAAGAAGTAMLRGHVFAATPGNRCARPRSVFSPTRFARTG